MVNFSASASVSFGGPSAPATPPPAPARTAGGGGGGGGAGGGGKTLLDDVFTVYKFWIEIESDLVAGFTEASGIQAEVETFDWLEGGENTSVLKFPGRAKYGNITL